LAVAPQRRAEVEVEGLSVSAYEVPTDGPESDGTLEWDATTIIVVEAEAGGETGLGYTYGDVSSAKLISSKLTDAVQGADALSPPGAWSAMQRSIRNAGQPGVGAIAISAVDISLWDLKAKLLGVCLADLLPRFHERVPVYGSGGFTSYSDDRLREQLSDWVDQGIPRVKVKVGRDPRQDPHRLGVAREVIGFGTELMTDGNGAYARKEALHWAWRFREEWDVTYFEEPLSSDDLEGLRMVRDRGPGGMAIAAGEYGWGLPDFHAMLEARAVDILQADVTRCGGLTNLLRLDGMIKARSMPFSAHCAPAVSAHACCAMETLEHLEYFHDHVRIERMLFDGILDPRDGYLEPNRSRPGLGIELKRADAVEFEVR